MQDVNITVIVPVYNSYYSIGEVVKRTTETLERENKSFEVILVDDLSQDESLIKINELHKLDNRVKVISLQKNQGQQVAVQAGLRIAKGEFIITIDDDLEHQPEDISSLLSEIKKGYDVVYAIPHNKNYPLFRKFGSKLVDLFFIMFLKKPSNCRVSSFRIMNRYLVDKIKQDNTEFVYITAMILKITQNISNIEGKYVERKYGKSNYNMMKLAKLYIKLVYYYRLAARSN